MGTATEATYRVMYPEELLEQITKNFELRIEEAVQPAYVTASPVAPPAMMLPSMILVDNSRLVALTKIYALNMQDGGKLHVYSKHKLLPHGPHEIETFRSQLLDELIHDIVKDYKSDPHKFMNIFPV